MAKVQVTSDTLVSRNEVPIIDLANIDSRMEPTSQWLEEMGKQLNHALSSKGLLFFINHGIAEERMQAVNKIMDTFCALPDNIKTLYKVNPPKNPQGYISSGMENLDSNSKKEMRECYNIQSFEGKLPTEEISKFKEVVGSLAEEFHNLARLVLKLIAIALELDPEIFLNCHKGMMKEDNRTTFRMLYYPPLGEVPLDNITRCGEHSDWGTFTLLTQDTEGGLEVFNGKEWSRVGHLPGAILLNLGDMMELWSSSQYKAIKHRVVVPEDRSVLTTCRHSIALFVHPDDNITSDPSFLTYCRSGEQVEELKGHVPNSYEYVEKKLIESFY